MNQIRHASAFSTATGYTLYMFAYCLSWAWEKESLSHKKIPYTQNKSPGCDYSSSLEKNENKTGIFI